jgi:hypothetical protein
MFAFMSSARLHSVVLRHKGSFVLVLPQSIFLMPMVTIGSFNRLVPVPQQMGGQLVPVRGAAADHNRAESSEHQGAMHRLGGRQVRRGGRVSTKQYSEESYKCDVEFKLHAF